LAIMPIQMAYAVLGLARIGKRRRTKRRMAILAKKLAKLPRICTLRRDWEKGQIGASRCREPLDFLRTPLTFGCMNVTRRTSQTCGPRALMSMTAYPCLEKFCYEKKPKE
jgi:hypothetical protein